MRPIFLALVFPALCLAQNAKPTLTFDKLHHDFGKVPEDRKVVHRFKANNSGTNQIQIRQIIPSCGCASTMIGQWHLKPGESTEVEVVLDPKGRHGLQRKSVQLFYDEGGSTPSQPCIATLTFEADVVQEIMLSRTALFFDDMIRSTSKTQTVKVQSGNEKQVKITDVKIPAAPFLSSSFRSQGHDVLLDITFDGSKVPAEKTSGLETLSIRTTNERMPQIPLDVQWNLRPIFFTTPSRVAWVDMAGKELVATLTIRHAEGKPFRILSAKPTHSLISVEGMGREAALQHDLTFRFSSKAKPGAYVEKVILNLSSHEQSVYEVRVSAVLK